MEVAVDTWPWKQQLRKQSELDSLNHKVVIHRFFCLEFHYSHIQQLDKYVCIVQGVLKWCMFLHQYLCSGSLTDTSVFSSRPFSPPSVFPSLPPHAPFITLSVLVVYVVISRSVVNQVPGQEEWTFVWQKTALGTDRAALFNFARLPAQEHQFTHQLNTNQCKHKSSLSILFSCHLYPHSHTLSINSFRFLKCFYSVFWMWWDDTATKQFFI